jgi:hypothetical protein
MVAKRNSRAVLSGPEGLLRVEDRKIAGGGDILCYPQKVEKIKIGRAKMDHRGAEVPVPSHCIGKPAGGAVAHPCRVEQDLPGKIRGDVDEGESSENKIPYRTICPVKVKVGAPLIHDEVLEVLLPASRILEEPRMPGKLPRKIPGVGEFRRKEGGIHFQPHHLGGPLKQILGKLRGRKRGRRSAWIPP